MDLNHPFMPGYLEVFCGPMMSGKTRELINRVDRLDQLPQKAKFFKPSTDTRNSIVHSRYFNGSKKIPCELINRENPDKILELLNDIDVVVIDEAQFFTNAVNHIVEKLVSVKKM
jgi:thymidine kinase